MSNIVVQHENLTMWLHNCGSYVSGGISKTVARKSGGTKELSLAFENCNDKEIGLLNQFAFAAKNLLAGAKISDEEKINLWNKFVDQKSEVVGYINGVYRHFHTPQRIDLDDIEWNLPTPVDLTTHACRVELYEIQKS